MIENEKQRLLAEEQLKAYEEALRRLEKVSSIPLLWCFHKAIKDSIKSQINNLENGIQEYIKSGRWEHLSKSAWR